MFEKTDTVSIDYRIRRGAISAYGRALVSSRILWWTVCAIGVALVCLLSALLILLPESAALSIRLGLSIAVLLTAVGFPLVWYLCNTNFIEPDLAFRKWLQQVCDGDLDARIDLPPSHRHYKELHFHTRNLAYSLMQLSTDMESLVESQTHKLEQQKNVVSLLFHLTADVAKETDREEVIQTVCRRLAVWWDDGAQVFGYLARPGGIECVMAVSSDGPQDDNIRELSPAEYLSVDQLVDTITVSDYSNATDIRIPIKAGQLLVGMLIIRCDTLSDEMRRESSRVFKTVSEQLSLFMTKQFVAEQAHGAQMLKERSSLAAEIHDSLAQTLLATRNQLSLLKESMESSNDTAWHAKVVSLEKSISIANSEVRELIHEYRSPLNGRRISDLLRDDITQFKERSGIEVFLQCDDPLIQLDKKEEIVVQRVVGEALVNAQKYASADMVRVYLHGDLNGIRTVLVEDDGVGFSTEGEVDDKEHFGMSIMQELALTVGAVLSVDSDPGEGTRVSLKLPPRILVPRGSNE